MKKGGEMNGLEPGTKISEISADFSQKFRFSVLVEKKFRWKNRLKKNSGKITKNRKNPIFS